MPSILSRPFSSTLSSILHGGIAVVLRTLKFSTIFVSSIYTYQVLQTYRLLKHHYHVKGFRWDQTNILYRALIDTTVTNFVTLGELVIALLQPTIVFNLLQSYYPELRSLLDRIQRTSSVVSKCLLWLRVLHRWLKLPPVSYSSSSFSLTHPHTTMDIPIISEVPLSGIHSSIPQNHTSIPSTVTPVSSSSTTLMFANQPTVYRSIPYGTHPLQTMDLYVPNSSKTISRVSPSSSSSSSSSSTVPILIFVHGGAWAWGKAFQYSTVSYNLCTSLNAIIINVDYRAYPYGSVDDMMNDILTVVKTLTTQRYNHILFPLSLHHPSSASSVSSSSSVTPVSFPPIYLCGHSAGAHLVTLAVLRCAELLYLQDQDEIDTVSTYGIRTQATKESSSSASFFQYLSNQPHQTRVPSLGTFSDLFLSSPTAASSTLPLYLAQQSLPYIKGIISISGIYDIADHYDHESQRTIPLIPSLGLVQYGVATISPMAPAMLGAEGFRYRSPTQIIQTLYHYYHQHSHKTVMDEGKDIRNISASTKTMLHYLPYILLIHGYEDTTVPVESSQKFYTAYQQLCNLLSKSSSSSSVHHDDVSKSVSNNLAGIDYVEVPDMGHADMIFDLMLLRSESTTDAQEDDDITLPSAERSNGKDEQKLRSSSSSLSMGNMVLSNIQKVLRRE